MATAVYESDYKKADAILGGYMCSVRDLIVTAIATERERCAKIADRHGAVGAIIAQEIRNGHQ